MEEIKLLGYYTTAEHQEAGDGYGEHASGNETTHFVLENGKEFSSIYSYGSCYSGYTDASWGDIETKLVDVNSGFKLEATYDNTFVTVVNGEVQVSVIDGSERWDGTVTAIKSTNGDKIVHGTGNGGCTYYSSGQIHLNTDLLTVNLKP